MRRPRTGLLENVPEMTSPTTMNDEGKWESESDWVIEQFQLMAYFAFPVLMDAQDYGSPMARIRWWLVVLDIDPACAKELGIEQHASEILNGLKDGYRAAPHSIDSFFICAENMEQLVQNIPFKREKAARLDDGWKDVHLGLCLSYDIEWPPNTDHVRSKGFGVRGAEVIVIAMKLFPLTDVNVWEFFDANCDAVRVFRLDSPGDKIPSPWRRIMPTLVASSQVVGRILHKKDGEAEPQLEVKKIHGLEAMRLMGWDLNMYSDGDAFGMREDGSGRDDSQSPELLSSLAGNAWCCWHTVPLVLAVLGSVTWANVTRGSSARSLQLRRRATTDSEDDSDNSH